MHSTRQPESPLYSQQGRPTCGGGCSCSCLLLLLQVLLLLKLLLLLVQLLLLLEVGLLLLLLLYELLLLLLGRLFQLLEVERGQLLGCGWEQQNTQHTQTGNDPQAMDRPQARRQKGGNSKSREQGECMCCENAQTCWVVSLLMGP